MPRQIPALFAFNRGLISSFALARTDNKRVAMGAETMTNFIPRVLGPMSLRPGFQYIGATASSNEAKLIPFVFSTTDTALVELTNSLMRVWVNDALVTRVSVSTAVSNGNFDTNLTDWTDNDQAGATSAWVTGGYMGLTGSGTTYAIRDQTVTVAAGDQNVEHALRIVIQNGPVICSVGTSTTDDSYVSETSLDTGIHSLSFTPTGNFNIRFKSSLKRQVLVDSCTVEAAGVMTIATPWTTALLDTVRADQSGDIIFCACENVQQRMIQRRSTTSWSICLYRPEDGPFDIINTTAVSITPTAISGNTTLTASDPMFRSTNIGSLFKLVSTGQTVSSSLSAENTFTNTIRVTGVGTTRTFTISITGTWVATVRVQYSIDSDTGPWVDSSSLHWTANTTATFADGLDNQIVWYRIGIKTGEYTSGTAVCRLTINTGSIAGVGRITTYSSPTSVGCEVLEDFGGTTAVTNWYEGEWSDRRGFPSAVRFHEGRLWWAGMNGIWGSVSDAFASYDPSVEGDSGTINRTIGSGPVDTINWLLALQRLIIGAQGSEFTARSSSLDEPLTPTNFNVKPASNQGSNNVPAIRLDQRGVFVQRGGIQVYDVGFDLQSYDYNSKNLTALVPELGYPGITRLASQRQIDTRLHCVKSDGSVMLAVYDPIEEVLAWCEIETDGLIEDVAVLPGQDGSTEDQVYYVVKRTINGSDVRYLEKWAKETECRGGTLNKQADSFKIYSGASTTTITGLSHLEGENVCVWADGADVGTTSSRTQTYTVSSGQITLATAATNVVVGLPYTGQWKSAKLGLQQSPLYTMLNQQKRTSHIGLVLAYAHAKGLRFGNDFTNMDEMPEIESAEAVGANTIRTAYDEQEIEFPNSWTTDLRICLQANAPRPVTILGVAIDMDIHD